MGENSPEDWEWVECAVEASVPVLRQGTVLLLLRAISANEVTRGGGAGLSAAPSLRRTGQLSMRSREPRRDVGDLSRLRS